MQCATCPEIWPDLLNTDGLCPNCACLRRMPGHRVATCPLCSQRGVPIECHHPGRKKYWPTVTIGVCVSCHTILTNRTVSEWSSLWKADAPVRCLLQGLADLVWLWSIRSATAPEFLRVGRLAAVALMKHFDFVPFRRL